MLHSKHINFNHIGVLVLLSLLASIGIGLVDVPSTHALTCDEQSMVSCIDITFGDIVGSTDLQAPSSTSTSHGIDRAYFYLPVSLTVVHASDYSIKVYSENGGELRSSNGDTIPTLTGEAGKGTSLTDLGKDGSVWGYRYSLGDTANDLAKNYLKVPGKNDPEASIISGQQIPSTTSVLNKVLTLGFATAVDGNLPAGSYSDKIVVAVTATPRQTSAFGTISTMQEMTPEICASATTPRVDAELPDATGIHHGDDRYVPETTLTDTRDGKSYLIRKLADGNCWMGQNLSLMLDPSVALTSEETDLNSKSSWRPDLTTQATTGTIWGQNDGVTHSASIGWNQYWAGGATFNSTGAPAQGGAVGYAQRGNYYNWFAATAGSGKATDILSTTDGERIIDGITQDSICPKGWALPVGGINGAGTVSATAKTFSNLIKTYTGEADKISDATTNTLYNYPLNFVPAGYYNHANGNLALVGGRQIYWSSRANTPSSANILNYDSGKIWAGTASSDKGYGFSVRCVAR